MVAWAFSPIIPVLSLLFPLFPQYVPQAKFYRLGSLVEFAMLFVITAIGAVVYVRHERIPLLAIFLTPLLVVLNTAGALWGWVSPVETFGVTEKVAPTETTVSPATVKKRNPYLEDGDFESHDGEGVLITDGGVDE